VASSTLLATHRIQVLLYALQLQMILDEHGITSTS
jgi:hypothetical protein